MFKLPLDIISRIIYRSIICVQYLRFLFSSFGEEDFQRLTLNIQMFKMSSIISQIMQVVPPFNYTYKHKDYV